MPKEKKHKLNNHKHVNHDPQVESAKAVFINKKEKEHNPLDCKI